MSGTGPEVLFGSNQRPERVSFPLFISFKKGHTSDIRPATLSSWLKQTILLCYKQADQQALGLVQVKAHDIRAFAASKAFYGGVSVDQIMQACHWKAHNTFTNFYLTKRPYLVRQQQQYVSGTSPRPFPSASSSSGRKEGGRGITTAAKSSGIYRRVKVLVTTLDVHDKVSYLLNCIMYLVFISVPYSHL